MKNVGNSDKIIRIIVGFCPLYALLGIKTTGKEQTK